MTLWERIKCNIFGRCIPYKRTPHPLVEEMRRSVEDTRQLTQKVRTINESGIWPRDLLTGAYRPRRERRHELR